MLFFTGSSSLVCKFELFKDWLCLLKELKYIPNTSIDLLKLNDTENVYTYNQVKLLSKDYQTAKFKVYEAFKKSKLGNWVTKPFEQNYFSCSI